MTWTRGEFALRHRRATEMENHIQDAALPGLLSSKAAPRAAFFACANP